MALATTTPWAIASALAAAIQGITPKLSADLPWRYYGNTLEPPEGAAVRTFTFTWDVDAMLEAGLAGTGDITMSLPLTIRVSYLGLPRVYRLSLMASDKSDLLALLRRQEGVIAGMVPPEDRGFSSSISDDESYIDHTVTIRYLADTT